MLKEGFSQIYIVGARKDEVSSEMRNGPDASIVLKVHVRLATGAQASRDVHANVTDGGGENVRIVCVNLFSDTVPRYQDPRVNGN